MRPHLEWCHWHCCQHFTCNILWKEECGRLLFVKLHSKLWISVLSACQWHQKLAELFFSSFVNPFFMILVLSRGSVLCSKNSQFFFFTKDVACRRTCRIILRNKVARMNKRKHSGAIFLRHVCIVLCQNLFPQQIKSRITEQSWTMNLNPWVNLSGGWVLIKRNTQDIWRVVVLNLRHRQYSVLLFFVVSTMSLLNLPSIHFSKRTSNHSSHHPKDHFK